MKFKFKALLLEDDDLCRDLMTEILHAHDFEVLAFTDPTGYDTCCFVQECLEPRPCVDVIVTDNEMPHMTGLEFLEKIKRIKCKVPDSHKVLVSGSLTAEEQQIAERIGCQFFHKPVAFSEISAWLMEKSGLGTATE